MTNSEPQPRALEEPGAGAREAKTKRLTPLERRVLDALDGQWRGSSDIVRRAKITNADCHASASRVARYLTARGLAERNGGAGPTAKWRARQLMTGEKG